MDAAWHDSTTPSEGGTLGTTSCTSCSQYSNRVEELESQVVDLTQRVRISDACLEVQEREMNIMRDMMEDMCTYIVHVTAGSTDEHPTIFSVPSPTLPSPTNILFIPEPVPWSAPSTLLISSTIATTSQDYSIDANRVGGDLQLVDVSPMMEPISENTSSDDTSNFNTLPSITAIPKVGSHLQSQLPGGTGPTRPFDGPITQ
ncbi:hypothetical protein EDC04DRAFT_2986865 [Pisolithus marmoratus]|nr:hypothetical protein EDC04DRAFT_2986865 [Pisolithus marmoratus]